MPQLRPILASMLAAFACAIAMASAIAADQTRVALVIGNAAYSESPLRNPVNDARAMATVLKQSGFKVIVRENATKQQMERAVAEFGQALTPGSVALFYYAGHGIQVSGHNFLVPVDAAITSEQVVRLESLDTDAVIDQLAASGSDVNLVILDACRNNPFERRFRGQGGGLAQLDAPKGTLIAYATAPGRVAADGSGSNGLYTAKLVEAINTPGIPIEEMFKRVRVAVSRETGDEQTPWEASSLVGDFYFSGSTTVVINAPIDRDALYWESVKDSSEPELLQTYLDAYPEGAFASLAKARLAALRRAAPAPASGNAAAFDGVWIGTFECGPVPDTQFAGWTDGNRSFAIKQGRVVGVTRWRQKEDGATGMATYTGTVDEAGQVTIVGLGVYDAGEKTYRIYYSGSIEDGELTAEGKQGARACTLAFHLAPAPTSAAAQPTAAALPDAPADGTWQGLYKCGPNDQNMAAFEDTGRVFTIKDGRLSGERRWKRADDGATGSELFSGLIGDDGQALIVGHGLPDKGGAYRIYHHGVLAKGHLTAVGRHGTRDCTLDYLLVQSQ